MYCRFPFGSSMILMLLIVALCCGSCIQKTDKYSKKDKPVVVDAQQVQIDSLQDVLIDIQKKVKTTNARAEQVSARCDSVIVENQALQAENSKLKAQLAQARDEVIPAMLQSYEDSYEAQRCAIEEKDGEITSLNNDLWNANNVNNALTNDRANLQTDFDNLSQHTKKLVHDSKRSFIKKFFGAGKAPVPDVPNPLLE